MLGLAGRMVDGGFAYVVDGTVYFDVTTYPGFGTLSGLGAADLRDLLAGRGGRPHESERAQSESVNQVPFVRRWLHTGMVRHEGEKMSKSLGNLVFPAALIQEHEPAAVRLALPPPHSRAS